MQSKRAIQVVSAHAEGEVGRVIVGGVLPPPGDTLPAQRAWLERNDGLRRFLIHEPRGGVFTHYNLIVPPRDPRAAAGFIVMEPTNYPAMSGSNSICVATVLLETGMVEMREPVTRFALETPGGLVEIAAECRGGVCERVTTRNVPSFVHVLDRRVEAAGTGRVPAVEGALDSYVMQAMTSGGSRIMCGGRVLRATQAASGCRGMMAFGPGAASCCEPGSRA